MAQDIFSTINPGSTSGNQLATILNSFKEAYVTGNSGTSRPTELEAGGFWIDTTLQASPNFLWTFKFYTGTSDITVFTLNLATNSASIAGSASPFEISKTSADSAGPILKLLKERVANSGQVLEDDTIGEIHFVSATDANGNPITGVLKSVATEDHTASANGTALVFEAVLSGATTRYEIMRAVDRKIGIGTDTPDNTLHVLGNGVRSEAQSDDAVGAKLILQKSRIAGSGAVQSSDVLGVVEAYAKDSASSEYIAAKVESKATEGHTASARGTSWSVSTTKVGANTLTEHLVIGDIIQAKTQLEMEMLKLNQQAVATTGTAIDALSTTKAVVNFTGSTATTVRGIDPVVGNTKVLLIHNASSAAVTLVHESGSATAANRMFFPNAQDISISSGQSIELFYLVADSRWKLKSGSGSGSGGGSASVATVQTVTSGGTITTTTFDSRQVRTVKGATGGVSASVTPFGTSGGWIDGTEIKLIGTDDADTLVIEANDASYGVVGNFSLIEIGKYKSMVVTWNAELTRWILTGGTQ